MSITLGDENATAEDVKERIVFLQTLSLIELGIAQMVHRFAKTTSFNQYDGAL